MSKIESVIVNDNIQVTIPSEYLKRAFELGITTNSTGIVTDDKDMLNYFCNEFKNSNDDSMFGRFIDQVCQEALNQGESFVRCEE